MTKLALLALVSAARADTSDSGNLTIGGTAVIQGTATVQGSAFSVGGTTFSVAGGSVTLGGRLNVSAAGISWADGSLSTTAASGGGSAGVAASSFTLNIPTVNFTQTVQGPCFAGSTVTATLAEGSKALVINAGIISPSGNNVVSLGFLIDGAFPFPGGHDIADIFNMSGQEIGAAFSVLTSTLPAGSHSFCLTGRVNSGSGNYLGGGNYFNRFGVLEVK